MNNLRSIENDQTIELKSKHINKSSAYNLGKHLEIGSSKVLGLKNDKNPKRINTIFEKTLSYAKAFDKKYHLNRELSIAYPMFTLFENMHTDEGRVIAGKAIAVGTLRLQSEGLINLVSSTPSNEKHHRNNHRSHRNHQHRRNNHKKHWWIFKHRKHNHNR